MEEESPKPADELSGEIDESVAFRLVDEALKAEQIDEAEAELLKSSYRRLQEDYLYEKRHEEKVQRRIISIQNEILDEKINIEKAHMDEAEEARHLANTGEVRKSMQQQLEFAEQRDTITKFELVELKKLHDDLAKSLANMKDQNSSLVDPILDSLKKETTDLTEQLTESEESFERQTVLKATLKDKIIENRQMVRDKHESLIFKHETSHTFEAEPDRLSRQLASVETAKSDMENEYKMLLRRIRNFKVDQESQAKRRADAERLRTTILQKLELNRQTLEEREVDVAAIMSSLEKARAIGHDLVTRKVELNIKSRDLDNNCRHLTDQLQVTNKDFNELKRQLKKKRAIAETARQTIPLRKEHLREQESMLRNLKDDLSSRNREIQRKTDEINSHTARLLHQEDIEVNKKEELEKTIDNVDKLETKVVHLTAESKKQITLLTILTAQREIKARDCARIVAKEKESKQQVRIKELVILDLTKRCNEISNRLKEFSALYEIVKNERNKYVNLIQSTAQALAEMREKIRILHNEVEILGNERSAKITALTKEMSAHQQAINQRDSLRQDLNRLLSEYRSKQGVVEMQIQEIDKLNVVINALEKDMLFLKTSYERAVEERNVTGVQLIDRNDELCILYERSNQQSDALRKGEIASIKKDEELRLLRLQKDELKRKYVTAAKKVPEIEVHEKKIVILESEIEKEEENNEDLSKRLEDPDQTNRWRPLTGNDLDLEQVCAKIQVLEERLDQKREELLERELFLEELTNLTEKLRSQAMTKRDAAKLLSEQLNDLHGRIRDITKKMLASVSELSMYQATALRLQQEKMYREKNLEESTWRLEHGEAPSDEAIKELSRSDRYHVMAMEAALHRQEEMQMELPANMLKTAAEPRPTAYIPDDLGIPKPYGNSAPFKPTEAGSTMRHFRTPVIKAIEI